MKTYQGWRGPEGTLVTVDGQPLEPRLDLLSLAAEGFEWGYQGNGPGQLALALLADALGDDARALALHRAFRDEVVVFLSGDEWALSEAQVRRAVADLERSAQARADDGVVEVPMTLEELLNKVRGR
ncbi:DUF6166 domain-containing protein [Roseospirillum parvum]|uniref:Uncharacterized protein n=1 Tax=Roseospirillum parvum TaxID=83401 RepID=A0A1G7XTC7_9PROT|nr:DUF6166 domain-containing protein [Roseospirillum parvum]SDG87391.1 hypothetical protein SAMN05421742_10389 [Roseospirillum parvum]